MITQARVQLPHGLRVGIVSCSEILQRIAFLYGHQPRRLIGARSFHPPDVHRPAIPHETRGVHRAHPKRVQTLGHIQVERDVEGGDALSEAALLCVDELTIKPQFGPPYGNASEGGGRNGEVTPRQG